MKILICYGTRPEWIKIKPLIQAFKESNIEYRILQVKQHATLLEENEEANVILEISDHYLNQNRLDIILSHLVHIPAVAYHDVTHVLVQGDTATALMCALGAFHRKIPVIHLEAGLRTRDKENPYPEETYRQLISRIADIHLAPTSQNVSNLDGEHVLGRYFNVGNTVLDNLISYRDKTSYGNEVLITLHRRENHEQMDEWFKAISDIALDNPETVYTLPIHPNPNVMKHKHLLKGVNVVFPIPYEQFIERLVQCKYIISDSGGIQEEASFLGKKVIVCRKVTERPETVGSNSTLCASPSDLVSIEKNHRENFAIEQNNTYGDGYSALKIVKVLKSL